MKTTVKTFRLTALAAALAAGLPATAAADSAYDALKAQVEALQQQLEQVQQALKQYEQRSATKQDVATLKRDIENAAEWKDPNTLIHMAGYANVGYTSVQDEEGSFNVGSFSPIFHFQYRDKVMLEAELEFEVAENGETEVGMEYMTIDLFLGDNAALVAGKFLSPVGQFRQNLHPSWINKLPTAPAGFGHDGAAPISDTGIQLRGGFRLGDMRSNYAVYVSNGPELNSMTEDGMEFELEGVVAEGFGEDLDGNKVFGGRLGILPRPGLEIGVSAATGKAAVTALENEATGTDTELEGEPGRDYDVYGLDFAWQRKALGVRGEYVKTRIGAASGGMTAGPGATWTTWYAQAAYRLLPSKYEAVVRYGDFDSPHASEALEQWVLGANYLFANNVIGKIAYEFNDSEAGSAADDDRWLVQLAYGF